MCTVLALNSGGYGWYTYGMCAGHHDVQNSLHLLPDTKGNLTESEPGYVPFDTFSCCEGVFRQKIGYQ